MFRRLAVVIWCCCVGFSLPTAFGQAFSDLPRAEYFTGKGLYGTGRISEAGAAFESALSRARRVGTERWVDSIPPLVMLGECYYQQGQLALALEHYDAALMLAIANPAWSDQLELPIEPLPAIENPFQGIDWFRKSQPSLPVIIPEAIKLDLDLSQARADPQQNVIVAPVGLVTRLDATEVLRTMGVALMRRWQLLGPLAKHSPLTGPMEDLLSRDIRQRATWLSQAWEMLRGLSSLSSHSSADAVGKIRAGLLVYDRFEYFMTPLGLIALASLEAEQGKYQAAIRTLQDTTLLAAQFEQHGALAESLTMLGACAVASERNELSEPLTQIASWAAKRSSLSQLAAVTAAAELQINQGDLVPAEQVVKLAAAAFRSREIQLGRMEAQLMFVSARLMYLQGRGVVGRANLDAALQIMRGSTESGSATEKVFQTQLTMNLFADNALNAQVTEELLSELLREPLATEWQLRPLSEIAAITTSRLPAFKRWLSLAVDRRDNAQIVARMNELQRQRFYESMPVGGLLFNWQRAAVTDLKRLPPDVQKSVATARQRLAAIAMIPAELQQLTRALSAAALPLDDRQMPAAAKKDFAKLTEMMQQFENVLMSCTLSRTPLRRILPGEADPAQLQQTIQSGDVLIGFAHVGDRIVGICISPEELQTWTANSTEIDEKLVKFLAELKSLGSASDAAQGNWTKSALSLRNALLSQEALTKVQSARRVIMVPSEQLWYLPFESLPGADNSTPSIAERGFCYLPMLGDINAVYGGQLKLGSTVGLFGKYFSNDKELNEALATEVNVAVPNSRMLSLAERNFTPDAAVVRINADQMWVAESVDVATLGWSAVPIPLGAVPERLSSWLSYPGAMLESLVLPGMNSKIFDATGKDGSELFLASCCSLYGGARVSLLSRWTAGGESSQRYVKRYLQELSVVKPSQATRHASLATWVEQFSPDNEPIFKASKDLSAISGENPLLWSSYFVVGDSMDPATK